eukprot:9127715-Pyramimonas_sp.AAC.1
MGGLPCSNLDTWRHIGDSSATDSHRHSSKRPHPAQSGGSRAEANMMDSIMAGYNNAEVFASKLGVRLGRINENAIRAMYNTTEWRQQNRGMEECIRICALFARAQMPPARWRAADSGAYLT